ncbi:hypothetical protein JTB14_003102 [Gonioctena quinquepunctata]|nr:hypothetical protein JTB14_003102 [Gonioctena quinquepunctata]
MSEIEIRKAKLSGVPSAEAVEQGQDYIEAEKVVIKDTFTRQAQKGQKTPRKTLSKQKPSQVPKGKSQNFKVSPQKAEVRQQHATRRSSYLHRCRFLFEDHRGEQLEMKKLAAIQNPIMRAYGGGSNAQAMDMLGLRPERR